MEFKEFTEFSNPEEKDHDIKVGTRSFVSPVEEENPEGLDSIEEDVIEETYPDDVLNYMDGIEEDVDYEEDKGSRIR